MLTYIATAISYIIILLLEFKETVVFVFVLGNPIEQFKDQKINNNEKLARE